MKQKNWKNKFAFEDGVVFLNHASFGPVTNTGRKAIDELMRRWGALSPGASVDGESFDMLDQSRRRFARLINAPKKQVAFAPNTSYGLNAVLWGLNLRRNERVLVPECEFPAVVYAVQRIAKLRNLKIEVLPCPDGYVTTETIEKALKRKAAVLVISWVQFFNGYRYDLKALSALCHDHDCFLLVDAIQGVGAVPLDVRRTGIDALACGAQKWLFGQTGSGFFYIASNPIRPVEPPYGSWLGVDWGYRFHDLQHWDRPAFTDGRRWEVGTYPFFALRFAHAGLEMLEECGRTQVWANIQAVISRLTDGLDGSAYQPILFAKNNRSGIVTIRGPRTEQLFGALKKRRILPALREGSIRISPHFHTTDDDIDTLLEATLSFERRG